MNASAADTKPTDVVVVADNATFSMSLIAITSNTMTNCTNKDKLAY